MPGKCNSTRATKLLDSGQHLTIDGHFGLRLEATQSTRTWVYRYKIPVDGKKRQKKIGRWPATSSAAAIGAWEGIREKRDAGVDIAVVAQQERAAAAQAVADTKRPGGGWGATGKRTQLVGADSAWKAEVQGGGHQWGEAGSEQARPLVQ